MSGVGLRALSGLRRAYADAVLEEPTAVSALTPTAPVVATVVVNVVIPVEALGLNPNMTGYRKRM
ncbi:hypothetical protein DPMN_068588 [Dreissena polymorpha]|uniref:Uncharacterized protein n=1 Tax=Dreissena polymorpha TaxID=45954 RepID=A0A9D4BUD6_DREPO|nr:hypothetical protein DPMN_068588 [Dreissena polymorpha]